MNWFFSTIRIAGSAFPVSSMLVQLQAEIDNGQINDRLKRLEDPISNLHQDIPVISKSIYKIIKTQTELKINLTEEEYIQYSRALATLESSSLISGSHAIGKKFAQGFRITDPTYVMYMCILFENTKEMAKLHNFLEQCNVGQHLNGKDIQKDVDLSLSVIGSYFKIYESKGYGICSNAIGSCSYCGIA